MITSTGIPLSQIIASKVICTYKVSMTTWWAYWSQVQVVGVYIETQTFFVPTQKLFFRKTENATADISNFS